MINKLGNKVFCKEIQSLSALSTVKLSFGILDGHILMPLGDRNFVNFMDHSFLSEY